MYKYTWYQWLTFFYIYCFFGWIFESTYVSLKSRHFVNRGFLRLPMLPLYGTGAVMMLWVSLPVKNSLILVYLSGVVAATLLEYVTGWGMERLFKMKYWDYSNQPFNVKGYICLSSSIAWGFLTIFLTDVIHRPIERYVLGLPVTVELVCVAVISILFVTDAAKSVKAALDLAKVLDSMTKVRTELEDIQVQMALLKADASQKVSDIREGTAMRMDLAKAEAAARLAKTAEKLSEMKKDASIRISEMKEETAAKLADERLLNHREKMAALSKRMTEITQKRQLLLDRLSFYHRSLLKGNPTASSARFAQALQELKEAARKRK